MSLESTFMAASVFSPLDKKSAALAFARLYLIRPKSNALPGTSRLQPVW